MTCRWILTLTGCGALFGCVRDAAVITWREPGVDAGPAGGIRLDIDTTDDVHPISPWIYGMNNGVDNDWDLTPLRPGIIRPGNYQQAWQNTWNWEINAANGGGDWCNQNEARSAGGTAVAGEALDALTRGRTVGAAIDAVVPILDWVAADRMGGSGPPGCTGDIRNSPAYQSTRLRKNLPAGPVPFPPGQAPDTNDEAAYQDQFAIWLRGQVTTTQVVFSLGERPDAWRALHPAIHPEVVTWDELTTRNLTFAQAIKAAVPDALLTGYSPGGYGALVSLPDAPRGADVDFVDYYLGRCQAEHTKSGRRLIDFLEVSWFSAAEAPLTPPVAIGLDDTRPEVVEARVQAPRSLWDDRYVESSWITRQLTAGPIRLFPRLRAKIATYYPGTRIALGAWSFGGGNHISGALATADALGIFGREEVAMAVLWLERFHAYNKAALQAFRNFDGQGSQFGDRSVRAQSGDPGAVSVYASTDSTSGRVTAVVINKKQAESEVVLRVNHPTPLRTAQRYGLDGGAPALVRRPALAAQVPGVFPFTLPPLSLAVLVLSP